MSEFMKKALRDVLPEDKRLALSDLVRVSERIDELERRVQRSIGRGLREQYKGVAAEAAEVTEIRAELNRHEMKVYSQNNEDGILAWLFDTVGATDRRFIEFGIGTGQECNTANLALTFGWSGLLMDCNKYGVSYARHFLKRMLGLDADRVQVAECLVTPENVNETFRQKGFEGEIDLLSIDIDSNDYWVWQAVNVVNPRVVVVEYNASFGPELAATMRFRENFDRYAEHPQGWFFGASVAGLAHLARRKGYILAGCDTRGVNAFFVRADVARGKIDEVAPAAAYYPNSGRVRLMSVAEQWETIKDKDYVVVDGESEAGS